MKTLDRPSILGPALAVLSVFILTAFFYGTVLFSPGEHLLAGGGDGLKNYYTFMYHVQHDEGVHHFKGMNYPYEELFIYTDGNPLLSAFIKWTEPVLGLSDNAIALYNLSILLALPLAALFISLIFRRAGVSAVYNLLFTLGIVMLHPQIERMSGHTTLTYLWVLPMVIYAYLRIQEHQRPLRIALPFGVVIFASYFLHPYLGMISSALLGLLFLLDLIRHRKKRTEYPNTMATAVMGIVPLGVFYAYSRLIDTVTDRVRLPWGFFEHHSDPQSVFLPHSGPTHTLVKWIFETFGMTHPRQVWAGLAYVGATTIIAGAWWSVVTIRKRPPFKWGEWTTLFVASVILLTFSFCIPFRWGGVFLDILDRFEIIRQFRALGRFAWPFFHVATLSALLYIYRQSTRSRSVVMRLAPILAAVLMIVEGWETHRQMGITTAQHLQPFDAPLLPAQAIDPADFDAIISLPHFMIGTDYYAAEGTEEVIRNSMLLSYQMGLPLMSSMMARTSISQTLDKVGLYEWGRSDNPIADDLPEDDRYLILADTSALVDYHRDILSLADPLNVDIHGLPLYSIDRSTLLEDRYPSILEMATVKDSSIAGHHFEQQLNGVVAFKDFNDAADTEGFYSPSSRVGHRNGFLMLTEILADSIEWGVPHEVLLWVKGDRIQNNGILVVSEKEPSDGSEHWDHLIGLNRFVATRGEWHLSRLQFTPKRGGGLKIFINGPWYAREEIVVDRLLLREGGEDVIHVEEDILWWNDLPIPLDDQKVSE